MTRLKTLLALLFALAGSNSQASVTYNWVPVSSNQLPTTAHFEITFSDAAVAAGTVGFTLPICTALGDCPGIPDAPVQSFRFFLSDHPDESIWIDPTAGIGHADAALALELNGSFAGNFFAGSIYAADPYSQITLSSTGSLFTITRYGSDGMGGGGCEWNNQSGCNGATGYLVRAGATQPVPEPESLALLGLGLVGVLAGRRTARTRK